jgi:type I restriction enzyme R subunit
VSHGPEYLESEKPLIDQLVGMGWVHTEGDFNDPAKTLRDDFRQVLLEKDLKDALRRINLDPKKKEWLDDARLAQAMNALKRVPAANLLEANQETTNLLLKGMVVDGVEGWNDGKGQTVHFFDWDRPERNTFRVVNQFRLDCPSGQNPKFITPDLVLFVNGIPLVVIECKSPHVPSALEEAIDQLQRYANRRQELRIVDVPEGNEELFRFSQVLVATCFERARAGTFSSLACHYLEWKDTSPVPISEVAAKLGKASLSSQETLAAGMLRPAHLLDIVRHFTLFMDGGGRTFKAVCRYQQFRAVQIAHRRLRDGKTRTQDGEHDRRGGIVWHTQGSGKSLTMVFLIRKMRSDPKLRRFKIVCITDRKDLEKQLADTAELTEEPLTRVKPRKKGQKTLSALEVLKETLALKGKDLVFAMIQKYRGERVEPGEDDDEEVDTSGELEVLPEPPKTAPLPVLNTDESILVIVDEAHRGHGSSLHANLLSALPNCARIAFTGTPIIMGEKKKTHAIFGEFIDRYTIQQSERDGATVKVLYEGRTTNAGVEGGGDLDAKFEDMFVERTPDELDRIKKKYGTKSHVMEARALIAEKARDMLRHYVANILPNGFKAQVVAVSRRATIRYYDAFLVARAELVAELESLDPKRSLLPDEELDALPGNQAFLARAYRFLDTIKKLEFAPVISGGHNDSVDPAHEWSDRSKVDARIARFKKPLFQHEGSQKADPLAFLIVKSMLLTGFDAPIEQVMYLDRPIKEAELLQAIARVNRTYAQGNVEKGFGIVVDYYGVARHLKEALAAYSDEDVEGALVSRKDEIPKLRDQYQRLVQFFAEHDVEGIGGLSAYERTQLAIMFCHWQHPIVREGERAADLGDGRPAHAARVIDALNRFLLAPTPGFKEGKDPYARLHDRVVSGLKMVLKAAPSDAAAIMDASEKLTLSIEPAIYKLLALFGRSKFDQLYGKRKGLATGIYALMEIGRSRYRLKLSPEEFEVREGWDARSSYENAMRDVVPARNVAGHEAAEVPLSLWQSTVAVLLGMIDENLADIEKLPEPLKPEDAGLERSVALLRDERLRAEFHVRLKQFLSTLDGVLPRPEALPYVHDAKALSFVQAKARNRYRGEELLIGKEVGEKVRKLIDDHVLSRGIDPKIPPISITDADFEDTVEHERSPEAKASEMEHALRYHVRKHFDEDPVRYEMLSERLDSILGELKDNWDGLVRALADLIREAREGRQVDALDLDPEVEAPFFDVLRKRTGVVGDDETRKLRNLTIELVGHLRQEIRIVDFWRKIEAQKGLAHWAVQLLDASDLFPDYGLLPAIADQVMELAKALDAKLRVKDGSDRRRKMAQRTILTSLIK